MSVSSKSSLQVRNREAYLMNPYEPALVADDSDAKATVRLLRNPTDPGKIFVSGGREVSVPAGFLYTEHVDRFQFVKLFAQGMKVVAGLSAAGTKVFAILLEQVRLNKNDVKATLHHNLAIGTPLEITDRTFRTGLNDLLAKDLIRQTVVPNEYWLNPDYLWDGCPAGGTTVCGERFGGRPCSPSTSTCLAAR